MSDQTIDRNELRRRWLRYGLLWLGLIVLLGVTIAFAYVPIGEAKIAVHLSIATIQILLLWTFFMNLRSASTLIRLTAASGFLWLIFMFVLTMTDYLSRS